MNTYIIHNSNQQLAEDIFSHAKGSLTKYPKHYRITTDKELRLSLLREQYQVDINLLPHTFNPLNVKAFVTDMDSTLIDIECIDEIADYAHLKPQVASITQSAMRGELDFNIALKKRVQLFKGLHTSILEKVYNNKLSLNSGAKELIYFLHGKHIYTAIASGGFAYFSSRLKEELELSNHLSNSLEEQHNVLTGKILGTIINAEQKAKFVNNLPYDNSQIITCGDGANDLEMMKISGLSVAYHAKQIVRDHADISIEFGGLDLIIDLFE